MKKKSGIFLFFFFSFWALSQKNEKTLIYNAENILTKIIPNNQTDSWTLVYNEYARDKVLKEGNHKNYLPQFSGFKMNPHEEGFYYIAASKGGSFYYIQNMESLRDFIGTIDNGEEAALLAITKGYLVDFEFKEYAANYKNVGNSFEVEVGKIISKECPLAKSHFILTIDKKTGEISEGDDLGRYAELYGKDCKNNPHYAALEKQMREAKAKADELKEEQRKVNEKMKKRLEKNRRKD